MPANRTLFPTALLILAVAAISALAILLSSTEGRAHAGQYLSFANGSNGWIEVADDPALTPDSAMTLETWVYLQSHSAALGGSCPSLIGKGYTSSYWLGICDGRVRIYPVGGSALTGPGTIPLNEWTHVAATYDGVTTRTYINGVLDGESTDFSGPIGDNGETLQIGRDAHWFASPVGAMDEVRIWNVARTDVEIAGAMNTTIVAPEAGLVGVWNMEGTADPDVGSFTATLNGSASFSDADPIPTFAPTPSPSPSPVPGGAKGDLNCDGTVDQDDGLQPLLFAAGLDHGVQPDCPAELFALPQGTAAYFGQSLEVVGPGDGALIVPYSADLQPAELTIEAWVYLEAYDFEGYGCLPLAAISPSWDVHICGGYVLFQPQSASAGDSSSSQVPLNRWTHVAVTFKDGVVKYYLNGELSGSDEGLVPIAQVPAADLHIGGSINHFATINGKLDEVRIRNVALSERQVRDMMWGNSIGFGGFVAAWPLDGDGTDYAGAHDGALSGSAHFTGGEHDFQRVDLNCDGALDALDTLVLYTQLAGIEVTLHSGCEAIEA